MMNNIDLAVDAINKSDAIIIAAGAGMGVDSGLPDFRGKEGFWKAYPYLEDIGMDFYDIASPNSFKKHPKIAWGFYGHRLNLYRDTLPHNGFKLLKEIIKLKNNNYFIYTSNVDGQFQKAGFSKNNIVETHGSIHHLQCLIPCKETIKSAKNYNPKVDEKCILTSEIPICTDCGTILRPNILMFDDWHWISKRTHQQKQNYKQWLSNTTKPVVIEIGAGISIPTIRAFSVSSGCKIIRINPKTNPSPFFTGDSINIKMRALKAITLLHKKLIKKI